MFWMRRSEMNSTSEDGLSLSKSSSGDEMGELISVLRGVGRWLPASEFGDVVSSENDSFCVIPGEGTARFDEAGISAPSACFDIDRVGVIGNGGRAGREL